MSARLLMDPKKPYELADDLESFVHVVDWLALKYHRPHNMLHNQLATHIFGMYDDYDIDDSDQTHKGGQQKLSVFQKNKPQFLVPPGSNTHPRFVRFLNVCSNIVSSPSGSQALFSRSDATIARIVLVANKMYASAPVAVSFRWFS